MSDATTDEERAQRAADALLDERRPGAGRLAAAKRKVAENADLLAPSTRGRLGCGVALVHAAAVAGSLFVLVAPCTAALPLGGVVPGVIALVAGGAFGIPVVLRASRRLRARLYERAAATLQRALPTRAGGGATTATAVSSGEDDAR